MEHIALYRKYRPKTFSEVVGQNVVKESLKNQVSSGKIGHAFLFTGTRGTGKTSCAKIFAKAINCINNVNGEPCLQCEICKGIENESIYDVTEMDAASNNSVEDIRDILSEVIYLPVMAKYRVYIIDEVHMLSTAAFNALLKTLEEPPAHVVFILATTEIHKVPATILSRCQRYDFNKLSVEEIGESLMYIAESENLNLTIGAAKTIASLADGAMRDATSILDTCLSRGNIIDENTVSDIVGISKQEDVFDLADSMIKRDILSSLQKLLMLEQKAVNLNRLSEDIITHFRNLLIVTLPNSDANLLNISPDRFEKLKKQTENTNFLFIQQVLSEFTNVIQDISLGQSPKIALDIALYKICNIAVKPVEVSPIQSNNVQPINYAISQKSLDLSQEDKEDLPVEFVHWYDVIDKVAEEDKPFYTLLKGSKAYLYNNIVYIDGHEALNNYIRTNRQAASVIKAAIEKVCLRRYNIGGYKNIAAKFGEPKKDNMEDILSLRDSGVEITIK